MLYVTSLDGQQVEPLIKFNNFKMDQDIKGTFKIDFNSFQTSNNPAHTILAEESIVTVDDFDFRVKQIKKTRTTKQVTALSTFYDLYDKRQNTIYGGTRTFNEFASFIFNGTGWTFTSNVTGSKFIPNFGENNIVALVNILCNTYNCEYQIMPNNRIHFTNAIGGDYDFQYRYGHNVKALSEQVDTSNLKTQIVGYGSNGLKVTYTSPNTSTFGIREAEPLVDERYTHADSMIERLKEELTDYPEVSIELDTVDLLNRELGERVWLIYEPLNIEFQTRIQSQTKQFIDNQLVTTKVTLGNAQIKTIYDVLATQSVKIDENNKITRSRFEQTNERITMEVEQLDTSIAAIDLKADNINLSVNSRITNEVAAIDLRADQIQSTVTSQSAQIGNMQSAITQTAEAIESKVSKTDYNGKEIVSLITQTPSNIKLQANKINFDGAVFGSSTATFVGSVSTNQDVNVGNNINMGALSDQAKMIKFGKSSDSWRNHYIEATSSKLKMSSGADLDVVADINLDLVATFGNVGISTGYTFGVDSGVNKFNTITNTTQFLDGYGNIPSTYILTSNNGTGTNGSQIRLGTSAVSLRNGNDTAFRDLYAGTIYQNGSAVTSAREHKKNIEEKASSINGNTVLDEIVNTKVYEYHLLNDLDSEIKRTGLILDESPVDIITPNGMGIDLYSMVSFLWKGMQEQQAIINQLKNEIAEMR